MHYGVIRRIFKYKFMKQFSSGFVTMEDLMQTFFKHILMLILLMIYLIENHVVVFLSPWMEL
jgi:hypothetical protein